MAATAITNTVLSLNTASAMPSTAAVAANEGALVTFNKADHKILIILENGDSENAASAIIRKGNALQGVADQTIALAAGETKVITIESGKYVNVSGDNKGKVLIEDATEDSTDVKVACVVLP